MVRERILQLVPRVAAIGEHVAQPWHQIARAFQQSGRAVTILHIRRMDDHRDRQADGVCQNMSSRAGEFPPHALPDPYVSLSAHTAPDVRPPAYSRRQWAKRVGSARITRANHSLAPAVRARSRLYL